MPPVLCTEMTHLNRAVTSLMFLITPVLYPVQHVNMSAVARPVN